MRDWRKERELVGLGVLWRMKGDKEDPNFAGSKAEEWGRKDRIGLDICCHLSRMCNIRPRFYFPFEICSKKNLEVLRMTVSLVQNEAGHKCPLVLGKTQSLWGWVTAYLFIIKKTTALPGRSRSQPPPPPPVHLLSERKEDVLCQEQQWTFMASEQSYLQRSAIQQLETEVAI